MIKLKNVFKTINTQTILNDINLEIDEGEFVVINGISGSGKSTLVSIIAGIMKPSSGLLEVDGDNIVSLNDFHLSNYRLNSVGFITQSFHLFDMLSVEDNILPALLMSKLSDKEIRSRVDEVMKIASIEHKAKSIVTTLSGGEKQRCIIARALVNNPNIILCDEPTANLDKENSLKFIDIMKKLKESGKTIIIATHDPLISELEFVDKIFKIDEGKIE